jgi:hypothetical protein
MLHYRWVQRWVQPSPPSKSSNSWVPMASVWPKKPVCPYGTAGLIYDSLLPSLEARYGRWVDVEHGDGSKPRMNPLKSRMKINLPAILRFAWVWFRTIAANATWGYQSSTVQDAEVEQHPTIAYRTHYCLQYPVRPTNSQYLIWTGISWRLVMNCEHVAFFSLGLLSVFEPSWGRLSAWCTS